MDKQTKGLMPGKPAALYAVLIVAAVFYGLSLIQDIAVIVSIGYHGIYLGGVIGAISADILRWVFPAPDTWKIILVLLFEAAAFVLPVFAAKGIYARRKWGNYLAYVSAAACAALIVAYYIAIGHPSLLSLASYVAICTVILVYAHKARQFLSGSEGSSQNEYVSE